MKLSQLRDSSVRPPYFWGRFGVFASTGLFLVALFLFGLPVRPSGAAPAADPAVTTPASGQILVKFRNNLNARAAGRLAVGVEAVPAAPIEQLQVHRFKVPPGREQEFVARFRQSPLVEYAEPDHVISALVLPNDPAVASGQQWYINKIDLPAAWDVTTGTENLITIGIVDTGIDGQHPDLVGRTVAGYNVQTHAAIPAGAASDDYWHGTHVAGIAGANANNGIGGSGVSWGAALMPVKVLDYAGQGTYSDLSEGIIWAADHGARVINMSLGGSVITTDEMRTLTAAVEYVWSKGALLVAASGNEANSGNPLDYPAAMDHVLSVAATDSLDARASFSNYNRWVDVAAPGVGIYSTNLGGGYSTHSGTSMATPVVSGLAALMLAVDPTLTPQQLTDRLMSTAVDLGAAGRDDYFGAGRVSAARAILTGSLSLSPTSYAVNPRSGNLTTLITVTNRLAGPVNWEARTNVDWLRVSTATITTTGRISAQSTGQLAVTIDPALIPFEAVTGTVQIGPTSNGQLVSPQTLVVELLRPRLMIPALARAAGRPS